MVDSVALLNDIILAKALRLNKHNELISLMVNLPNGAPVTNMVNFLNGLKESEISDFFTLIYSKTHIDEISKEDYESSFGNKLFQLEPKGLGKAELFLATLIRDSVISGGGQSFDLKIGEISYEVKDYRRANSDPIRLGTKGKVTRFAFWAELLKSIRILKKYSSLIPNIPELNIALERADFILGGEFNKTDVKTFTSLYTKLNEAFTINHTGYTSVKFYSPTKEPVTYSIVEIKSLDPEVPIILQLQYNTTDSISNDIRRIKYVRNPLFFAEDLQLAVDSIIDESIPFIVFRPSGPIVTTKFKFDSISQGGIYIRENLI